MATDSFVFYRSFIVALKDIPPEEFKETIVALAAYALDDEDTPELSGAPKMAMSFMKPIMDSNKKKRENGRHGGLESGEARRSKKKQDEAGGSNSEKSRSNGHGNGNEAGHGDENGHTELNECESTDPKKLFLNIWQHTPDVFNALARIESPKEWENFWRKSNISLGQVKTAMNNIIEDVKSGVIELRYVPSTPDRFVLKGWITKCQKRFQNKTTPPSGVSPSGPKKTLL